MNLLIKNFRAISIEDVSIVGGKNASLGEMYNKLSDQHIKVPDGYATTADAFKLFLSENNLVLSLKKLMTEINRPDYSNLSEIGMKARKLIRNSQFSKKFSSEILKAYENLGDRKNIEVAVRSSATAEDLPSASFAGQHDTFLYVAGSEDLLHSVKECFASLYTDRAIKYREDRGFSHEEVALSVGVQKMVRADKGCSGVGFTIEPESGFKDIIQISGVFGLGENIVQGTVNPDEFYVFKTMLRTGKSAIVQKKLGSKAKTMIYSNSGQQVSTKNIDTDPAMQKIFVLSDEEVTTLANWALAIEYHYGRPMDIEWAKDGISGELFIIQARPETVHRGTGSALNSLYQLKEKSEILVSGDAVGSKIVSGPVRILHSPKEINQLEKGDVLVTETTSPDWDPLLQKAGAVITNQGGRTSHAAIVARELGVPAIVGTNVATMKLKDGEQVTVSCAEGRKGYVYQGALGFVEEKIDSTTLKLPKTEAKLILSDPDQAFHASFIPNHGVGLLRMEFIITHLIKVHPMALVRFDDIKEEKTKNIIADLTSNYTNKEDFFIDQLSQGLAVMASAFYPKEVIVRMSDFKTNEYSNLIGGDEFEPKEENPMLGFRGAARYYSEYYKQGFALECKAIRKVRESMGLNNIKVMIPFCRTLDEAGKVIEELARNGLVRKQEELEILMMVEIPSNVILIEEFAKIFDGFSIGSNDLTQLVLGIDRDSHLLASHFDENDPSAKEMIRSAIEGALKSGRRIGLCGQAPSDIPEFAAFLIKSGISSISFTPDAIIRGIKNMNQAENEIEDHRINKLSHLEEPDKFFV